MEDIHTQALIDDRQVDLRALTSDDLAYVLEIDWAANPHDKWPGEHFCTTFTRRCIVVEFSQTSTQVAAVVGYIVVSIRDQTPIGKDAYVLRLAVHEKARRLGVGRLLLSVLTEPKKSKEEQPTFARVLIDAAETNLDGQLFLKACGFKAELRGHLYHFSRPAGGWPCDECETIDPKWRIAN